MGACVEKEKQEAPSPGRIKGPLSCWARGDYEVAVQKAVHDYEMAKLKSEVASLKRENRGLRERFASVANQLELPPQAASGKSEPLPPKQVGFSRELDEDDSSRTALLCGGKTAALDPQLLNSLFKAAWPFVSQWFENKMRQEVEPAVQAAMPAGLQMQFGEECHLGTTPISVHDMVTTTYTQPGSMEGEDIQNVRIVGEMQYHGDCKLEVAISAGKIVLTGLIVVGAIVIELVRLVPQPPFFSGIRLYFPNPPEVSVQAQSEMLGLAFSFAFIRGKIVQALSGVIARSVVLPNRFAIALMQDLDPFPLRHPRPQGVLRVAVLEAKDLRAPGARTPRGPPGLMLKADPYVVLSVGSTTWHTQPAKATLCPSWDHTAIHDFFVMDLLAQVLRIEVRDADHGLVGRQAFKKTDFLGQVEVTVADLVDCQHGPVPCERWLPLEPEAPAAATASASPSGTEELGQVRLQVQWRPLAHAGSLSSALLSSPAENCWTLGQKSNAAWILFVGVYSATMLPPAPDGTQHWVTLSISEIDGRNIAEVDTVMAQSRASVRQDIDSLNSVGLSSHLIAEAEGRSLVDAEWDAPVLLLLDAVRSAKVTATVWRRGGDTPSFSLSRLFAAASTTATKRSLGSASYTLGDLLQCKRLTTVEELPLEGGDGPRGAASVLKLRLQIRPLLPPPGADSSLTQRNRVRLKSLEYGLMPLTQPSILRRRTSLLNRDASKEASLFMDFHTPDNSDSDSESRASEPSEGKPAQRAQ